MGEPGDRTVRALVFDSIFDIYRGVVSYVRIFSGRVEAGSPDPAPEHRRHLRRERSGPVYSEDVNAFAALENGDVGYIIANIKSTSQIKIGDTLTDTRFPRRNRLPGFQEIHPMVFSGIYPINTADFEKLKTALGKLQLNDAAFVFQPESSVALGFGFRCGFLGLLHMEIIQERLRREYDMDIIATYPSVIYEVLKTNGEQIEVDNPTRLPDPSVLDEVREPDGQGVSDVPEREHRRHHAARHGQARRGFAYRNARHPPHHADHAASRSTRSWWISTTRSRA